MKIKIRNILFIQRKTYKEFHNQNPNNELKRL